MQGTAAYAIERLMEAMKAAVSYRMRPLRPGQAVPKHSSQQLYDILRVRTGCSLASHPSSSRATSILSLSI